MCSCYKKDYDKGWFGAEEDDWHWTCLYFEIHKDYTCGHLIKEVPTNLGLSSLFSFFIFIAMIIYSGIACGVACCRSTCGHYDPNAAEQCQIQQVVGQPQIYPTDHQHEMNAPHPQQQVVVVDAEVYPQVHVQPMVYMNMEQGIPHQ